MTENETVFPKEGETEVSSATEVETKELPSADQLPEDESDQREEEVPFDYSILEQEDLDALKAEFPSLREITSVIELDNPTRYAQLRDLGLSAREAYLATAAQKKERTEAYDNRSHLHSSVPKSHGGRTDVMSIGELQSARELFMGLSDNEIVRLYKKVNS